MCVKGHFLDVFIFLVYLYNLKSHSKNTFLIIMADDFEGADFGGVFYMKTDAETFVIIAYMNHTDSV